MLLLEVGIYCFELVKLILNVYGVYFGGWVISFFLGFSLVLGRFVWSDYFCIFYRNMFLLFVLFFIFEFMLRMLSYKYWKLRFLWNFVFIRFFVVEIWRFCMYGLIEVFLYIYLKIMKRLDLFKVKYWSVVLVDFWEKKGYLLKYVKGILVVCCCDWRDLGFWVLLVK